MLMKWLIAQYRKSPTFVASIIGLLFFLHPHSTYAKNVSPQDAWSIIQNPDLKYRVIDVRTPQEYNKAHLPGAININVADANFPDMIQRLSKSEHILVYCRSGRRSAIAVKIMEELGFFNILHMNDGWIGWENEKLPIDREAHY